MKPSHYKENVCCCDCQNAKWEHDRYLYRCLLHDFTMEDSEAAQHSCDDYNEWQYIREEAK